MYRTHLTSDNFQIFMERPIRVARSRRFLRKEADRDVQSEDTLSEQSQKVDEA